MDILATLPYFSLLVLFEQHFLVYYFITFSVLFPVLPLIIQTHLMHGYTSDPPVLLEDFLHISLHYLERVQVPNKNPESEN